MGVEMTEPSGRDNGSDGSGGPVSEWRNIVDEMRRTRGTQFLRVSRKMLNHLCSIGLKDAQKMLAEVEGVYGSDEPASESAANVPGARVRLEDSPLMTGTPFELAADFLGDEEITERVQKWIVEDKASFFSTVVGDPRCTMPEIADAVRRYNDVLRGRSGLAISTLKSLRVSLIQRFLTEQLDYINVAKEVVRITDFHDLLDQMIMTRDSHGKMGGKAAGLLLAHWILHQPEVEAKAIAEIKMPRTWSILSDGIMDFIRLNELGDVMEQKFKEISQVRREYPNMIQLFKNSTFPPEISEGLVKALEFFGDIAPGHSQFEPSGRSFRHCFLGQVQEPVSGQPGLTRGKT